MTMGDDGKKHDKPMFPGPFAFGEKIARQITTPREAALRFAASTSRLNGYEARGALQEFFVKSALVRLGGLDLLSCASSSVLIELGAADTVEFVVMLAGSISLAPRNSVERISINCDVVSLQGAAARIVDALPYSAVVARIDPVRLLRTLDTISGGGGHAFGLDRLHETQTAAIERGNIDFRRMFGSFFRMLDAEGRHGAFHDQRIPEILGLDDHFYRLAALSLAPELLFDGQPSAPAVSHDRIDMLCDAIRSARDRFLTLTEMEVMTGLSRRALQYIFFKHFRCSPMAWQRRERLRLAHEALTRAEPEAMNIAKLGYELGFASPSSFADFYRRMFGETPGATLRRRKTGGGPPGGPPRIA